MHTTNNEALPNIPTWFKPLTIILLIWNLLGLMAFVQHMLMDESQIATLPVAEQALYQNFPQWVTLAFACAVFGGLGGCLALLLKKTWAIPLFWLSLAGVLVQTYHSFFMSNAMEVYGSSATIMPLLVLAVAGYLLWLSHSAANRHWLQ
jgi:ABC-type xylose transport system permease subunit